MASIKDQVRVAYLHDGKDHVNVSAYGASESGRLAFPEWRRTFYIPHLGEFASARAFANWCVSGGKEELRRHTGFYEYRVENIREFRTLMLYAKFFQLTALRASLTKEENLHGVPWMMYKKHLTGVREHHRWEEYPGIVKAFVIHIVKNGNQAKFDFESVLPGVTEIVNRHIRAFAGEDFVGIEKIDEVRNSKKEQKRADQKAARGPNSSITMIDEAAFIEVADAKNPANPELQGAAAEPEPATTAEPQTGESVQSAPEPLKVDEQQPQPTEFAQTEVVRISDEVEMT